MKKYIWWMILAGLWLALFLGGCAMIEHRIEETLRIETVIVECRHMVVAQAIAAIESERYDEVRIPKLINDETGELHAQLSKTHPEGDSERSVNWIWPIIQRNWFTDIRVCSKSGSTRSTSRKSHHI
jgi:hypothetical protein